MTQDATGTTTEAAQRLLERRVRALEAAVLVFPVIVTELLLVLGLLVPFVTDKVDGEEQTVNLFGLVGGLFAPDESGEVSSGDAPFGVAFIVLIVVIIGSLLFLPSLARSDISPLTQRITLTFVVLLIAGTLGAWMVMGMGLSSNSPWIMEPALPILSVGSVLAALLAFLPVYRGLWKR